MLGGWSKSSNIQLLRPAVSHSAIFFLHERKLRVFECDLVGKGSSKYLIVMNKRHLLVFENRSKNPFFPGSVCRTSVFGRNWDVVKMGADGQRKQRVDGAVAALVRPRQRGMMVQLSW